jgi:hypothetical protein
LSFLSLLDFPPSPAFASAFPAFASAFPPPVPLGAPLATPSPKLLLASRLIAFASDADGFPAPRPPAPSGPVDLSAPSLADVCAGPSSTTLGDSPLPVSLKELHPFTPVARTSAHGLVFAFALSGVMARARRSRGSEAEVEIRGGFAPTRPFFSEDPRERSSTRTTRARGSRSARARSNSSVRDLKKVDRARSAVREVRARLARVDVCAPSTPSRFPRRRRLATTASRSVGRPRLPRTTSVSAF